LNHCFYFSSQWNKRENGSSKVAEMQRRHSMQRGMKMKEMFKKYIIHINQITGYRFIAFLYVNLVNRYCPVNIIFSLW